MDDKRDSLIGRRALVTGAASGIGREVAAEFVRRGALVVAVDRASDSLDDLCKEMSGESGKITPYELDLLELDRFDGLLRSVENELGGLDLLANVAGVTRWKHWDEVTLADWQTIFDVNARALFFLTQKAVPLLQKDRGGSVVNISSIAGKGFRRTSSVAYAGSKAAVIAMSRVLSAALAPMNIRVNCICPGPVDTPFLAEGIEDFARRSGDSTIAEQQQWVAQVPLGGRAAIPLDIADLVCFLCADTGRCVTGQAWNVDGGLVFD